MKLKCFTIKNNTLKTNIIVSKNQTNKKEINLYIVDFYKNHRFNIWFENICKDKFIIKKNENNPDYLIYNVFGTNI